MGELRVGFLVLLNSLAQVLHKKYHTVMKPSPIEFGLDSDPWQVSVSEIDDLLENTAKLRCFPKEIVWFREGAAKYRCQDTVC